MNCNYFHVPEKLDIDKIINENRFRFSSYNLSKDKLLFICASLVSSRASNWRRMEDEETEFAPLCSKSLKLIVNNYKEAIKFLSDCKVIVTDGLYIIEEKCLGYKFCEKYTGCKLHEVPIDSWVIRKKIRQRNENEIAEQHQKLRKYSHLIKWWQINNLTIDDKSAVEWIEKYCSEKLEKTKDYKDACHIIDSCETFKILVKNIQTGNFRFKVDNKGKRLYTPITNLKKELRQFLKYKGKELVSIDIKNSQPYLAIAMFEETFWYKNSINKGKLRLNRLNKGKYEELRKSGIIYNTIMLLKSLKKPDGIDFSLAYFISLVVNGKLYEYIQSEFQPIYKERFENRDKTKKEVMRVLYFNPKIEHIPFYEPCLTFRDHFKSVYELFKLIKVVDYKILPIILQRIESFLLLEIICRRIEQLNPEIPLFTIHDSILTTKGNEGFIEQIMSDELYKWIGYPPRLKKEDFNPSKMNLIQNNS